MAEEIIIRIIGTPSTDAIDAEGDIGETAENKKPPRQKKDAKTRSEIIKAGAISGALLIGKEAWSFATSNIGKYTGDAKLQQKVNKALEYVGYSALIAASPVIGSISLIASKTNDLLDLQYQRKWDNIQANVNADRLGRSATSRSGRNVNRR
jgi:hypothetical protein